jgi:lipid-A-disaccharide synthase
VSPLTYALGRWRIKVPHFAMVNLIAGEEIVPELVQDDFTAANVVARLNEIIPDGPARERMLEGLARVKACLRSQAGGSDLRPPSERAADVILGLLARPGRVV